MLLERNSGRITPSIPTLPRWLAVARPGAETEIILYVPDENGMHYTQTLGKTQSIRLNAPDTEAAQRKLKAKGVMFVSEPEAQPRGTSAIIQDPEGNELTIVEDASADNE